MTTCQSAAQAPLGRPVAFDPDAPVAARACQRQPGDRACCFARPATRRSRRPNPQCRLITCALAVGIRRRGSDVRSVSTCEALKPASTSRQSREAAREQHAPTATSTHRRGDLANDERVAQPPGRDARIASTLFQRMAAGSARAACSAGTMPKRIAGDDGDRRCEREDAAIDRNVLHAGNLQRVEHDRARA